MNILPFLEIMVNRPCNLSCKGCTTFSDLKHTGYTTWEDGKQWLLPWTKRLDIKAIGFMGGEPLMNPEIDKWILGVRELLPECQLRFVTNGTLLHKHWKIFELLRQVENSVFKISYHIQDQNVDDCIEHIENNYTWEPVYEYGIHRFKEKDKDFRFQIARPTTFFKTFLNDYDNMMPHNNNPVEAFAHCCQQRCPLLFEGKIFKCGTAGLTQDILKRFNWPNREQWENYLNTGLHNDCSDEQIKRFVHNFGKPHSMCRQCPTSKDHASIIDHRIEVAFK